MQKCCVGGLHLYSAWSPQLCGSTFAGLRCEIASTFERHPSTFERTPSTFEGPPSTFRNWHTTDLSWQSKRIHDIWRCSQTLLTPSASGIGDALSYTSSVAIECMVSVVPTGRLLPFLSTRSFAVVCTSSRAECTTCKTWSAVCQCV